MKNVVTFVIAMLLCIAAAAQTQQGYVKTKGRMVNGKLVPGQGLKGATISVKGRTAVLVNSNEGAFSFPVPNGQYHLDSVKKNGYQLIDMDICPRSYKASANPLFIVMETPEQQLQDKLNAERKIRRNLQKQLQAKEDEIEALKEENKISLEEYQTTMQRLYEEQESNEQLIADMAKRYSALDYDQLDEFYRQVSYFIENGELVKADSMLNTRGDLGKQVEEQLTKGQAIQEQQAQLDKAKDVHAADQDELARRCYSYYETFSAQHMNDTAAYFLELRASLDTTNAEWQNDAGDFIFIYTADYDKALSYFQKALRQAKAQNEENNLLVAKCYFNIGTIQSDLNAYSEAIESFKMAYNTLKPVVGESHEGIAEYYNSIGRVYDDLGDYPKAMENYEQSLAIATSIPEMPPLQLTYYYHNLGSLYSIMGDTTKALEYLNKSLAIRESVLDKSDLDLAISYNAIGIVYDRSNVLDKAMYYYSKELEVLKTAVGDNHPYTANNYNNIGVVYEKQGEYDKALEYYEWSLALKENFLGNSHSLVAFSYYNIGNVYRKQGNYPDALNYHTKALNIRKKIFGENHPDVGTSYNEIAYTYYLMGDYAKTLEYFQKASNSWKAVFGEDHPYIALSYNNIGHAYFYLEDYPNSLEYYNKSYALYKSLFDEEYPECVKIKERIEKVKEKMK